MLISITLTLVSEETVLLPQYLGRANYAAALARLNTLNTHLGKVVHQDDGPKPLTCSGLLNSPANRAGTPVEAGKEYFIRLTGLTKGLSQALEEVLLNNPPEIWELDRHPFQIAAVTCDEEQDPWSGRSAYETLAATRLLQTEIFFRSVRIRFASPTSFRSGGRHVPLPLPGLVFGSLADRWNAFSPVQLNSDIRRFADEMMVISSYQLRSRPVPQKGGGLRIGGVGNVTYRAFSADRYWLGAMQLLADFARFSGVGVQTASGMGQARRFDRSTPAQRQP